MALYTRKGDKGDTGAFGCCKRFSKSSIFTEALGSLDELNSFLGICKIKANNFKFKIKIDTKTRYSIYEIIENIQNNLFIIQAKIAGADKKITEEKIFEIEKIIDGIEKELSLIKSFFLPGGSELAAYLDYARAVSRKTERKSVAHFKREKIKINDESLTYLNRLSSLLYALARFVNFKLKIKEKTPDYK
ncbi:cob(I)yrinic acid a,c-diamide adenosyltransferase [Candidatus Wolfebacteria bacterium]|nr:cob(I)yrinic acid a,c-diamide adenosyltransferase [Candidatus Wolfebacteria bacterium]